MSHQDSHRFHGLAITEMTANTSLGDTVTACAAARGRLGCPAQLERLTFESEEGTVPVTGHPVPTVAGFQGGARLVSLALPALLQLVREAGLDARQEVAFVLATPDLESRAAEAGVPAPPDLKLIDKLVALSGLPSPPRWRRQLKTGHTGLAEALLLAQELLDRHGAEACVVGGVDTLCDDLAVALLAARRQLKTGDNPVGLQPGEAAACLVVRKDERTRRLGQDALARVEAVARATEAVAEDALPVGKGLAAAITALEATGSLRAPPFYVLDRNGEAARANDWGYCLQRLTRGAPRILPVAEWDPALSFGDTGAASGFLAAQLAIRGFARGYAPAPAAVVLSSSDTGERSAVCVTPHGEIRNGGEAWRTRRSTSTQSTSARSTRSPKGSATSPGATTGRP